MLDVLLRKIDGKEPNPNLKKAVKDAKLYKTFYTCEGIDTIIDEYRKNENPEQKKQRNRIAIGRTKHICRNIDNVIDQLDIMDKPAINVISENQNEQSEDTVRSWIYQNNINELAFSYVKYFNMIDANTFIVCRKEDERIIYQPVPSANLYDIKVINKKIIHVIFRYKRTVKSGESVKEVYDYEMYTDNKIIVLEDKAGKQVNEGQQLIKGFIYTEMQTERMFCFPVGYTLDPTNDNVTRLTILDPASELLKSITWQGSDLDTDIATHGFYREYAYASQCKFSSQIEDELTECQHGYLYKNGIHTNTKCSQCGGTGLVTHTSGQDIITFPLPNEGENQLKLSDLSHIVTIPESIFEFKKKIVEELETKILHTIFNNGVNLNPSEIQQTATEKVIDLQGLYAFLNQFGKHVSEMFIWMCECYCDVEQIIGMEFIHGYTLSLKLETVESLAESRKKLIDANAPIEVIKAFDLAILRKQHMDSPQFINRFAAWQYHKPFSDKSDIVAQQILASLPLTNRSKVLYMFWDEIRKNIELSDGDKFFDYPIEKQKDLINEQVTIKVTELQSELPERMNSEELNF